MKVGITGGSGFLGRYVAEKLKSENCEIVIFSRSEKKNAPLQYVKTDYTIKNLCYWFKKLQIEAVVHLAAKRGSQDRIEEFHDNEILTQNLYEACTQEGVKNIIFASSISVYSIQENLPWSEENLPVAETMYGISKLVNENIGNIYSTKKNLYIKNLRLAHLYGFNEKNNYMINLFFRQAYHKKALTVNGNSHAKREFLYVKDAANAIFCGLKKEKLYGTFNIGSTSIYTNLEVASKINEVFNNKDNIKINFSQKENIGSSYMIKEKSEKYLDYKPMYTFEHALKQIYLQMKDQKDVPIFY